NSSAKLPDNFRKLKAAIKCEPFYYEVKGNKDHLQSSYFWKERIEQNLVWNEETEKYEDGCNSKVITEKLFYHDNHVNFHYRNPTYLTLTKGFNKDLCDKECVNYLPQIRNTSPHEINITNSIINTNFSEGNIYLWYRGFLLDENGDIIIPETIHGRLTEYLTWYVKYRIALDLIANGRNVPYLEKLLPIYIQEKENTFSLAIRETKFAKINSGTYQKMINLNRAETLKYELSFPII